MRRSLVLAGWLVAALAMVAQACGPIGRPDAARPGAVADLGTPATSSVRGSPAPSPLPAPSPSPSSNVFVTGTRRLVPTAPPALAFELTRTTLALRRSIADWVRRGHPSTQRPPRALVLQALYQQRIYRVMARHPRLAMRTVPRLPRLLVREARRNTSALANLFSLPGPIRRPRVLLQTRPPLPAGLLFRYYRQAERRFGVSWAVLAAVNFVESKFGRVRTASPAGARGPMQFLPSTWGIYGLGGDIDDPHDAILGAANYLRASGAPASYRRALYVYNHAVPYVNAVLQYARQMLRRPQDFLEYYDWQVFVITPSGEKRLTGPRPR